MKLRITLVVLIPNITTNHAITYINCTHSFIIMLASYACAFVPLRACYKNKEQFGPFAEVIKRL